MRTTLIPFALSHNGRIVAADEVSRGLECRCICLVCREALLAKQGQVRIPHFAHVSSDNGCFGGGESALHLAAKQCLFDAQKPINRRRPKTIKLGLSGYHTVVREVRLEERIRCGEKSRQVDAIVRLDFLHKSNNSSVSNSRYMFARAVAVEIMVTHAKEPEYGLDMHRIGMPAVEKEINGDSVYEEAIRRGVRLRSALTSFILVNVWGCCRWLSIAGLPDEVALGVSCYDGPPDYIMDKAEEALKKKNWDQAREWTYLARPVQGKQWARVQAARWRRLEICIQSIDT